MEKKSHGAWHMERQNLAVGIQRPPRACDCVCTKLTAPECIGSFKDFPGEPSARTGADEVFALPPGPGANS